MRVILNKFFVLFLLLISSCDKNKSFTLIYSVHNNSMANINITYSVENSEVINRETIYHGEKKVLYTTSKTKHERDCKKGNPLSCINIKSIDWVEGCNDNPYNLSTSDCSNWISEGVSNYTTYTLKVRNKDFD